MASLHGHQHRGGAAESKLLHGVLDELLPQPGGAADADALDALLAGEDDELWNAPALFGNLAPGLQCSEACHRPGQRCLDPTHSAHCTKCVAPRHARAAGGAPARRVSCCAFRWGWVGRRRSPRRRFRLQRLARGPLAWQPADGGVERVGTALVALLRNLMAPLPFALPNQLC